MELNLLKYTKSAYHAMGGAFDYCTSASRNPAAFIGSGLLVGGLVAAGLEELVISLTTIKFGTPTVAEIMIIVGAGMIALDVATRNSRARSLRNG